METKTRLLNNPALKSYSHLYGIIGYPLGHSFSRGHFNEKFEREGLSGHFYEAFPIETIEWFPDLLKSYPNLRGLNVTIPYKKQVIPFLDFLDEAAAEIGAVNVIRIIHGKTTGYNSDVYGLEKDLGEFLGEQRKDINNALVLGTGGAAKAVKYLLKKWGIPYLSVSRTSGKDQLHYDELLPAHLEKARLIINTTPLGMAPDVASFPEIPYGALNSSHFLYDLVYNPALTTFMKKGQQQGAHIRNGLGMLYGQAAKAWEIWNNEAPGQ